MLKKSVICVFVALFLFMNLLPVWAETAEEYYLKGVNLYHQKNYEDAISYFDKAIALDGTKPGYWTWKGEALYEIKKYEEAIKCFDNALELNPCYTSAEMGKERCLIALENSSFSYENLIQPGIGIGPFQLGNFNVNYIKSWLGEPSFQTFIDGDLYMSYSKYKMTFTFMGSTGVVRKISTDDSQYKTALGIGVGSHILDAQRCYPSGSRGIINSEIYTIKDLGMSFVLNELTGLITDIYIYPAK